MKSYSMMDHDVVWRIAIVGPKGHVDPFEEFSFHHLYRVVRRTFIPGERFTLLGGFHGIETCGQPVLSTLGQTKSKSIRINQMKCGMLVMLAKCMFLEMVATPGRR